MSMNCDLKMTYSPISPEESAKAFEQAFAETANLTCHKKHLNELETELQTQISQNLIGSTSGIKSKDFHLKLENDQIYLVNHTKNNYATKYEYGTRNQPPYSYIKPSAIKVANELADKIVETTVERYEKITQGKSIMKETIPDIKTNYTKKYKH